MGISHFTREHRQRVVGKDVNQVETHHMTDQFGHALMMGRPGSSVRGDQMHRSMVTKSIDPANKSETRQPGTEREAEWQLRSSAFAILRPYVFAEGMANGSAVHAKGFIAGAVQTDHAQGRFMKSSDIYLFRPFTKDGLAAKDYALMHERYAAINVNVREFLSTFLPEVIVVTDDGVQSLQGLPHTFSIIPRLSHTEPRELTLGLREPTEDEILGDRLVPYAAEFEPTSGLTIGRLVLDPFIDYKGQGADYTQMGFRFDVNDRAESLAGVMVESSSQLREVPFVPVEQSNVVSITKGHRAG